MKISQFAFLVVLSIAFFTISGCAQEQRGRIFVEFEKLEYFNRIANSRPENLVFRLLQFNAPFGGIFNDTQIHNTGKPLTMRMTPFARQNTRRAELTESQFEKIKQTLSKLTSNSCIEVLEPQDGELYSVLVFNNGKTFLRCNFIGQIPSELQEIKDFLKSEFDKAEEKWLEDVNAKEKLVREKYGDWESNPQNFRLTTVGSRNLKNGNMTLLYLKGKQQPVTETSKEIPLYYALVLYPKGRIVGGAGGGTFSFEPFSRNGISWAIADGSYKPEKELVIEYSVIDGTISVEDKIFKLKSGNLFIIRFDENWKFDIKQLNDFLKESVSDQTILSAFERELGEKLLFHQLK